MYIIIYIHAREISIVSIYDLIFCCVCRWVCLGLKWLYGPTKFQIFRIPFARSYFYAPQ